MSPTQQEIKMCKEILARISDAIPARGYTEMVKQLFRDKGLSEPANRKIYAVRAGKEYSLPILKALEHISRPRDESDELVETAKWEPEIQTEIFEQQKAG